MPDPNLPILERAREEAEARIRLLGHQAGIDYLNSLIDVRIGIVAGDGCYRSRAGFDSSAHLLERMREDGNETGEP
jgi:hypothetical protein